MLEREIVPLQKEKLFQCLLPAGLFLVAVLVGNVYKNFRKIYLRKKDNESFTIRPPKAPKDTTPKPQIIPE